MTTDAPDHSGGDIPGLLAQARAGDPQAVESLMDWTRTYLRSEARQSLRPKLRVRVDDSDLVQKVSLTVFQELADFRGSTEAEFAQWLKQILKRDVLQVVEREAKAAKRAVDREVQGSGPIRTAIGQESSPSRRAIRNEELRIVREAINQLPEELREVMWLKHVENLKLAEIVERLGKTEDAVTGLLFRGMKKLKPLLRNRGLQDS